MRCKTVRHFECIEFLKEPECSSIVFQFSVDFERNTKRVTAVNGEEWSLIPMTECYVRGEPAL